MKYKSASSETNLSNAISYAEKIMVDVDKTYPAYDEFWMVHMYDYFRVELRIENPGLVETIEHFSARALLKHSLEMR